MSSSVSGSSLTNFWFSELVHLCLRSGTLPFAIIGNQKETSLLVPYFETRPFLVVATRSQPFISGSSGLLRQFSKDILWEEVPFLPGHWIVNLGTDLFLLGVGIVLLFNAQRAHFPA